MSEGCDLIDLSNFNTGFQLDCQTTCLLLQGKHTENIGNIAKHVVLEQCLDKMTGGLSLSVQKPQRVFGSQAVEVTLTSDVLV